MFRIVGAVLVIAGCTAIGFFYKERFCEGLAHLRSMQQILELFMSEIRYGKATLPECCGSIAPKAVSPYGEGLMQIWEDMKSPEGLGFVENWNLHMGRATEKVPVTKQEKEMFLGFAACLGLSDNQMQVRAIEQYRDMLASAIKLREAELEKQSRLATGLGIMSGLLLAVILI